MQTVELKIGGMTCNGCVNSVKRVLAGVPGVQDVDVSLTPGKATVRFDPSVADVRQLETTVEDAGYEVLR